MIRYYILISTTEAGSGHPTSSLSAVELMTALMFSGIFRFNLDDPQNVNNDRLIFSKGHATPLLYALFAAAGRIDEEGLKKYRQFGSPLEGHPTMRFPYTEAATGSLGQGLSVGTGIAINAKYLDKLPYRTYVLLGDSEMAEGSIWEAIQIAAYYKLNNLIGIIDVNRLGQSGPTMYGHEIEAYEQRIASFGWHTIMLEDGHSLKAIGDAYTQALDAVKPVMIIARTIKGKGVDLFENKEGWHGKPLNQEQFEKALVNLGSIDRSKRGDIAKPEELLPEETSPTDIERIHYKTGQLIATRQAFGQALVRVYPKYPDIVALDAEVGNSTFTQFFEVAYPKRFFQMFIAEQNMVGTAVGLASRGKIPFISTFATFLSRAYDQIRMSQYSSSNIKIAGSHVGVSIGEDGPSQMGLADIALFRTFINGVVLYPSDAVSTEKLVEKAAAHQGNIYLRLTRMGTPVIYDNEEEFHIGGSKVLKADLDDQVTVVAAGVTLYEALAAYEQLKGEGILVRVIDLYCIKPIDEATISQAATDTKAIITVEDHYPEGGLGEAVKSALPTNNKPVYLLAVGKMPRSGKPRVLLDYESISRAAIARKVKEVLANV